MIGSRQTDGHRPGRAERVPAFSKGSMSASQDHPENSQQLLPTGYLCSEPDRSLSPLRDACTPQKKPAAASACRPSS
eukprot:CAMPEP_0183402252 /NCGR_PEP_ID=MMETSP0370-20130417/13784_1 /TAXON_ID=268820 /ORGANISM="Peridinium aciculiferum, Strain PAER-2" /LENGTH=76 /DNA_ID=CAMNT_0025583809 /DNA_START=73 /DNA_END=303 /DNA_ORIENTATION=+